MAIVLDRGLTGETVLPFGDRDDFDAFSEAGKSRKRRSGAW